MWSYLAGIYLYIYWIDTNIKLTAILFETTIVLYLTDGKEMIMVT